MRATAGLSPGQCYLLFAESGEQDLSNHDGIPFILRISSSFLFWRYIHTCEHTDNVQESYNQKRPSCYT